MVALIRFGAVGVSSPPAESSSLWAAEVLFRFVPFFRGPVPVGEGDGSSRDVLSGMTFYQFNMMISYEIRTLRYVILLRLNIR